MSTMIERHLDRYPSSAVLIYAAVLLILLLICVSSLAEILRGYSELNNAAEQLTLFERRLPARRAETTTAAAAPPGAPFLEESTRTIASAALLQRLTSAITRVGGTLISSEVIPQSAQSKDGYVKVSATCNLEQGALQQLLHEIEGGMPFLFIDQLLTQADTEASKDGYLRTSLTVTGLWRAAK